jgi:amino acid permease
MFSIINEIKDNSPASIFGVIGSSIGTAASIYVLVSITGYITFGNDIVANIISMCKLLAPLIGATVANCHQQILLVSHQPSERRQLSSSFFSPSPFKCTHAVPPSVPL